MRKYLYATAMLLGFAAVKTNAQVVSGNGFFKGTFVEAGIQPSGAFGSKVAAPSDYVSATVSKYSGRVGFIADVGKDGWAVGTPKFIGDFFVPGTPYEAFSVKMNGTLYENSGSAAPAIPGTVTGYSSTGTEAAIEWEGTINNLKIRQITSVGKNSSYILIRVFLKNTGSTTINNIFYTRSVDPDNEVDQVGSAAYTTINKIEEQNPNSTSTALVSGKGQTYGSYLGLGSRDCRARVAIMGSFSSDGESIYNGTGEVALSAKNATNTQDDAIAVTFKVGNLAPGDSTAVSMAYVLNAADLPPAMDETDPLFNVKADTYGSGSIINVCSGSTATLNIINGDGYTWTWSPATNLDKTTGRSVQASLTGDITYTASGINSCGTSRSIQLNLHPVVAAAPGDAGAITGPTTIYQGWNATYSVPEIAEATTYKWTIPAGASFISGYGTNKIVIRFGTGSTSGTVSVYGENSCGVGASTAKAVTLSAGTSMAISSDNNGTTKGAAFATPTVVDDKVNITGSETITNPRVYIDAGFHAGDLLSYTGELPGGISVSYNEETGSLSFTGSALPSVWQSIFREIKFSSTSGDYSNRTVKYVLGDVVSLTVGGKPHYYEYVQTPDAISWADAHVAAASRTFYGLAGYLATSTSAAENNFITAKLLSDGWIGGSDHFERINEVMGTTHTSQSATEGKWYWVTGPEAGTPISTGNNTPVAVGSAFMKWADGEPNDMGNEHYMQLYSANEGKWNDLSGAATDGLSGYVVEYGGYSSDPSVNITYSRVIKNKPAAPAITQISDDTGESTTDRITSDNTLRFSGTATANSTIKLTRTGVGVIGTVTADASGNWTVDYSATTLPDGTHTFTATSTVSGEESEAGAALTVIVDHTAPTKPYAQGMRDGDGEFTNNNKPSIEGLADANTKVAIYVDGVLLTTVSTDSEGKWDYTFSSELADGEYTITTIATDVAGNTSETSAPLVINIDKSTPTKPGTPVVTEAVNGISKDNTPQLTGVAEPNSTVEILVDWTPVATVTADGDGKWEYVFSPALEDESYSITVTASDKAGNKSEPSEAVSLVIDTQAPLTPAVPALDTDNNDGAIKTNTPSISGTTEPFAKVYIYDGEELVAELTADVDGKWNYTFNPALTDGNHEISVVAEDAGGNKSGTSETLTLMVDTHVPAKPSVPELPGANEGNINNNLPVINGEAEPGSTVTIYVNGEPLITVPVGPDGKWMYEFTPALSDGDYSVTTKATDIAGNTSEPSSPLQFTVDTQKPVSPSGNTLNDASHGKSNNSKPTISGEAEPGSTVTIYNNGVPVATVKANGQGKWTYTFEEDLADGAYEITTEATDVAGNKSEPSVPFSFMVDTKKPVVPSVPSTEETNAHGYAKTGKPSVHGVSEPGSTVTIYDNGVPVATVVAGADGEWQYTFDPSLSDGNHELHTTSTDSAGNVSAPGAAFQFMVDTKSPQATLTGATSTKGPFMVTIKFDEAVENFSMEKLMLTNCNASSFTKISDTEYTIMVSPTSDKMVGVQLAADAATDMGGNGNLMSNQLSVSASFSAKIEEVFPNPASNQLHVRFGGVVSEKCRVILVKMSGQVVLDQQAGFQNNVLTINVSKFASGVYTLMIKAKDEVYQKQILIAR